MRHLPQRAGRASRAVAAGVTSMRDRHHRADGPQADDDDDREQHHQHALHQLDADAHLLGLHVVERGQAQFAEQQRTTTTAAPPSARFSQMSPHCTVSTSSEQEVGELHAGVESGDHHDAEGEERRADAR